MSKLKRPVLQRFVADHPEKAVDVLIKCCHDQDIAKDIIEYLLDQQPRSTDNSGNNDDYVALAPKRSPTSQRTGSFSSNHRQSTRNYASTGAYGEPMSPPKTRSNHSKSLSGKDGRENVVILAMNEEDDIEKHPATMMVVPIEYSVINEHMFDAGRICGSNIEEIDEEQISVPRRGVPGTVIQITVSSRAELTWKRSKSHASHKTIFYLVPQEFLDIDLLLGSLDSGEGISLTLTLENVQNWHTLHVLTDQICQKRCHRLSKEGKVSISRNAQSPIIALRTHPMALKSPLVFSPTSSSKIS
jgi:hypothetical protein